MPLQNSVFPLHKSKQLTGTGSGKLVSAENLSSGIGFRYQERKSDISASLGIGCGHIWLEGMEHVTIK